MPLFDDAAGDYLSLRRSPNDSNHSTNTYIRTPTKRTIQISAGVIVSVLVLASIIVIPILIFTKKASSSSLSSTSIPSHNSTALNNENIFIRSTFDLPREVLERLDWKQWMIEAANKVYDLHNWNDYQSITVFNKTCTPQVKGRFHRLKWLWDCRLKCDGIIAESSGYESRGGAVKHALEDYLTKLGRMGLITSEQIQQFQ